MQLLTVKEGKALFEKNAGQRVLGRLADGKAWFQIEP